MRNSAEFDAIRLRNADAGPGEFESPFGIRTHDSSMLLFWARVTATTVQQSTPTAHGTVTAVPGFPEVLPMSPAGMTSNHVHEKAQHWRLPLELRGHPPPANRQCGCRESCDKPPRTARRTLRESCGDSIDRWLSGTVVAERLFQTLAAYCNGKRKEWVDFPSLRRHSIRRNAFRHRPGRAL